MDDCLRGDGGLLTKTHDHSVMLPCEMVWGIAAGDPTASTLDLVSARGPMAGRTGAMEAAMSDVARAAELRAIWYRALDGPDSQSARMPWTDLHADWQRAWSAVAAAEAEQTAALQDCITAERTRYVMANAGWQEMIRQLQIEKKRTAALRVALRQEHEQVLAALYDHGLHTSPVAHKEMFGRGMECGVCALLANSERQQDTKQQQSYTGPYGMPPDAEQDHDSMGDEP